MRKSSRVKSMPRDLFGKICSSKKASISSILDQTNKNDDSFVTLERSIFNSSQKNKENLFDKDKKDTNRTPQDDSDIKVDNIASLLQDQNKKDEDSFSTLDRSIVNSCKKNKEKLFDEDKKIASETPRRDTYIVTSPLKDLEQIINESFTAISASPELKKSVHDESLNVTLTRGSEKKTRSEKKNRKSSRKVSFVTPLRKSARVSCATPQYNSVKDRPKTPMPTRLSSVKKHVSFKNKDDSVVGSLNLDMSDCCEPKGSSSGKIKRPSTPMPLSKRRSKRLSSAGIPEEVCISQDCKSTPKVSLTLQQLEEEINEPSSDEPKTPAMPSAERDNIPTSEQNENEATAPISSSVKKMTSTSEKNGKQTPAPVSSSVKKMTSRSLKATSTPLPSISKRMSPRISAKSTSTPGLPLSSKKTPDFRKLHQKEFDKMESIDDYQKRKTHNSAKKCKEQFKYHFPGNSDTSKKLTADKIKKIPKTFCGIPYVPSFNATRSKVAVNITNSVVLKAKVAEKNTRSATPSASNLSKKRAVADSVKKIKSVTRENTPLKQRHKFDLKASLAKKLPYKPHSGPLKPLTEVNLNNTLHGSSNTAIKKEENQVIKATRSESREVLRGVRKNKRFLLQMNNRKLNTSVQQ